MKDIYERYVYISYIYLLSFCIWLSYYFFGRCSTPFLFFQFSGGDTYSIKSPRAILHAE